MISSLKLLPETRNSEQNVSQFQVTSLNPGDSSLGRHVNLAKFREDDTARKMQVYVWEGGNQS